MRWIKEKWKCLLDKMLCEKASPVFIARGWAIGMFYGCTIPFGVQLVLSIPTAIFLKGSKVGATLGTLISNHFTIFIIYPAQCWIGNRLLGGDLTYHHITEVMQNVFHEQNWQSLAQLGNDLMCAFFLGGFLIAAVTVPFTYFGVLHFVRKHRTTHKEENV